MLILQVLVILAIIIDLLYMFSNISYLKAHFQKELAFYSDAHYWREALFPIIDVKLLHLIYENIDELWSQHDLRHTLLRFLLCVGLLPVLLFLFILVTPSMYNSFAEIPSFTWNMVMYIISLLWWWQV